MSEGLDEVYYYSLRAASRSRVVQSLNRRIKTGEDHQVWQGLTICSIDRAAIDYARLEWPKYYGDQFGGLPHSWERLTHKYRPNPAYFDVAIWQKVNGEDVLQGMAIGQPSNGKTRLSIYFLERSFAPNYLKAGVELPILSCAEEYAKLLGSKHVVLRNPLDPGAFTPYGYAASDLKGLKDCLSKEIQYG